MKLNNKFKNHNEYTKLINKIIKSKHKLIFILENLK